MTAQRRVYIGTSWSITKSLADVSYFASQLAEVAANIDSRIQPFVIPSISALPPVAKVLANTSVLVGAQNMHSTTSSTSSSDKALPEFRNSGARIMEMGMMLQQNNEYVFDKCVGRKIAQAQSNNLVPLVCVGESYEDRKKGQVSRVLATQVSDALRMARFGKPVLLAYEPIWAMGDKCQPPSRDYIMLRLAEISAVAAACIGWRPPCLYGGSITLENCADLIKTPQIDGLLMGRAEWHFEDYLEIVRLCACAI